MEFYLNKSRHDGQNQVLGDVTLDRYRNMRKKRIAIIAPTPAPYRAFEYDQVQTALRTDYEFLAMFMERRWNDMQWMQDLPEVMRWRVLPKRRLPLGLNRLPGLRRVNSGVETHLTSFNPHGVIMQGHDSPTLWTAFYWARSRRRAVLYRSDSSILKDQEWRKPKFVQVLKCFVLRYLFRRVDAFLTIGSANEEYYLHYGVSKARLFRAAYMVDANRYGDTAEIQRQKGKPLKKDLGIVEENVILFVGRFVWEKDLATLLRAFFLYSRKAKDTALLLVGDGPQTQMIEGMAARMERIYFAGFQQPENLGHYYGAADVLVLPSVKEAWGLVVAEAMAAGLPVVASDKVGAGRDLVLNGKTGQVFKAGSAEALANSLEEVLCDKERLREMSRNSQIELNHWNERFDIIKGYSRSLDMAIHS